MLPALPIDERRTPCPADVFLSRFTSRDSQRAMAGSVQVLGRMILGFKIQVANSAVPWHQLTRAHVLDIRSRLAARYSVASVNRKHLVVLRQVLTECWRAGLLTAEQLAHLIDAARNLPGDSLSASTEGALTPDEIERLFRACAQDRSTTGARDAALLALLFGCGLRRASAVRVQLDEYERTTGRLIVHAKGGKIGALYLPEGARKSVEDWLIVRGTEPGPLVTAVLRGKKPGRKVADVGGRVILKPLHPNHVQRICARRALDARLERPFRPHDARRAAAGQAIDVFDLSGAQQLLMHSSPNVTARYDLRGERRLKTIADRMQVPHYPRKRAVSDDSAVQL